LLWAVPAVAVTRTPYNTNLVKNGNFEAGNPSPDGYTSVVIPGWHSTNSQATVVKYGTALGFPTLAEGQRISGGKQFYASGPRASGTSCAVSYQQRTIRGRNAIIDSAHLAIKLTARVGTYSTQSDTATILVSMVDSNGDEVGSFSTPAKSATNGRLEKVSVSAIVPPHTRSIQIDLFASNTVGYCDAYFDNITIKISPANI